MFVFADEFSDLTINMVSAMTDYESAIQGALRAAFMGCVLDSPGRDTETVQLLLLLLD